MCGSGGSNTNYLFHGRYVQRTSCVLGSSLGCSQFTGVYGHSQYSAAIRIREKDARKQKIKIVVGQVVLQV